MTDLKTSNMEDRSKLKKLVEIIGEQIKIKGNDWLVTELLETIGDLASTDNISKHSVIQSINEYCIEDKIKKQAQEFYQYFPITEIKEQLVSDYIKMEHERRRDDFENFCLCMYQQVEAITNYLFDKKVYGLWESKKNQIAIATDFDENLKKYRKPSTKGTSILSLVFKNASEEKWYAGRKFRAIMYFFVFDQHIERSDYEFNNFYFLFDELYQIRNQNHRGGKSSEHQQKVLQRIYKNKSQHYFKLYGFLNDFITRLEQSKSFKPENAKPKKRTKAKSSTKTTFADANPELEKLKNKLEQNN